MGAAELDADPWSPRLGVLEAGNVSATVTRRPAQLGLGLQGVSATRAHFGCPGRRGEATAGLGAGPPLSAPSSGPGGCSPLWFCPRCPVSPANSCLPSSRDPLLPRCLPSHGLLSVVHTVSVFKVRTTQSLGFSPPLQAVASGTCLWLADQKGGSSNVCCGGCSSISASPW